MNYQETAAKAANGDFEAFRQLYAMVYKELYDIAFLSLGDAESAKKALAAAAEACFGSCGECKNEVAFKAYFVRNLCEQIITAFRDRRKSGAPEPTPDDETGRRLMKLTEAERISVVVFAVCGYNERQISIVTGLRADAVAQKLESAKEKLAQQEDVLYL